MVSWTLFFGPVVGGVIGGFTNKVAIKMLFRPYTAKYIGKVHVPFTPGIIPKEKSRIAKAIGSAVSENLLNNEVLMQTLLSDEMIGKIEKAVDDYLFKLANSPENLYEFVQHYVMHEKLDQFLQNTEASVSTTISGKLSKDDMGDKIADMAIDHVKQKSVLGRLASTLLYDTIHKRLSDSINELLQNSAPKIISDFVHDESKRLQEIPIRQIVEKNTAKVDNLKNAIVDIYKKVIANKLPNILTSLDIQKIIEQRINDMDMAETERIIISVMDKELKALVGFGVILGFLMGFVTNLMYLF